MKRKRPDLAHFLQLFAGVCPHNIRKAWWAIRVEPSNGASTPPSSKMVKLCSSTTRLARCGGLKRGINRKRLHWASGALRASSGSRASNKAGQILQILCGHPLPQSPQKQALSARGPHNTHVRISARDKGCSPFRVDAPIHRTPRVARASQPLYVLWI